MRVVRVRSSFRRTSISRSTGRVRSGGFVKSHTRKIK